MKRDLWAELAERVGMTREYTKQCAYVLLYGGCIDPWLDYLLRAAIDRAMREAK